MMYQYLPGTPPTTREGGPLESPPTITPGTLTPAQADQYVTEITRRQLQASVAQCDSELAEWQMKDAMLHDYQVYIDAAKAQEQAIPHADPQDPAYFTNEARRTGLLQQISTWESAMAQWDKADAAIADIQRRRDYSATYLQSMPPAPGELVGYPVPTTPLVSFAEASANWPPITSEESEPHG
jgi:hypothetical protein